MTQKQIIEDAIREFLITFKGDNSNFGVSGELVEDGNVVFKGMTIIPCDVLAAFVAKKLEEK